MNKKKLYKVFKKVILDVKKQEESKYTDTAIPMDEKNSYNDLLFTESDDDIKKRGRNLIFRLLTLRDQLHININDRTISINSELTKLKGKSSNTNHVNYDEYFSLEIINKVGYILSCYEKRFAFKDEYIYEETIEKINMVFKKVNQQNFEEIYQSIMKESGLARESNLDDLLN
jgi:hypothetical protein